MSPKYGGFPERRWSADQLCSILAAGGTVVSLEGGLPY